MPPLKERKAADNIKLETIHTVDGIRLPRAVPVLQICGTKIFVAAYLDRLWFVLRRPRVSGEGPIAVPATLETAAAARFSSFSMRHVRSAGTDPEEATSCFSRRTGGGNCRSAFSKPIAFPLPANHSPRVLQVYFCIILIKSSASINRTGVGFVHIRVVREASPPALSARGFPWFCVFRVCLCVTGFET
ncbi:hypothetical protein AMK01_CH01308 [Rhizobium sp. N6212]|nr:hypothetical protein AMK01_CH01308 [Rhizobium sp. N6212]ANK96841.1 hypothetical protein AMK00_CH01310 [Rhizobium sp. N621]ANL02961.1 hypothetical protein AMJ99_CH01378 [Rhizobium esperanzae]ANL09010.1 hypothetical protein AMJ98_CH01299 [Rhizobium sp. N1341]ANL21057.1 hypothetical protein AMJ96_CH01302 [Rhizobium sp. N113]ANM33814.1 hypothetical protein AMK04_CH01380 [Rhizobium sp. N871]ANM39851.1 hypothetical protein AMK03_CH01299 [Rhizobium sp. N741]